MTYNIYQIAYLYNANPHHYISLYRHVQYLEHFPERVPVN